VSNTNVRCAGFQPVVHNARTWKMPKNATHARTESVLSLRAFFKSQIETDWLLISVLLICIANPACVNYDRLETGIILRLCRTWTRLCTMPSVIFSSNQYRQTWNTDSEICSVGADVPDVWCSILTPVDSLSYHETLWCNDFHTVAEKNWKEVLP